jgi:hypothetical protein
VEFWVAIALASILWFLIGAMFGARRAFRLVTQARKMRGAHSRLARFMPEAMPKRTAADILAGRIRIVLGGVPYDLPVLPRNASRKWIENLDGAFASMALALDEAGDDTAQILSLLSTQTELMYAALLDYDTTEVLPSRDELDEVATDAEVLQATLEVWRAANPLLAVVAETATTATNGTSPAQQSSPPSNTDGVPTTSSASLTSSLSSISTPPENVSTVPPLFDLRKPSKPSGLDTSLPEIEEPIRNGPADLVGKTSDARG